MFDVAYNSFATRKNWKKYVLYPEHKNKNKDLVVEKDFEKNVVLIDRVDDFEKEVKQWEKDIQFKNSNALHNIKRDFKDKKKLKEFLDNKRILTTYRISENNIFFSRFFNSNIEKTNDFYSDVIDTITNKLLIPKKHIISAAIHYDQTSPHLHISVSNLYKKYNKELDLSLYTSNNNNFNIIQKMKFYYKNNDNEKLNISLAKDLIKYGFLYWDKENHIYMSQIRGYEDKDLVNTNNLNPKNYERLNDWISNFRQKGLEIKLAKFKSTPDYKNEILKSQFLRKHQHLQEQFLLEKNEANLNQVIISNLAKFELQAFQKHMYFKRMDLDLATLGLLKEYEQNDYNVIERSREYNKILELCEIQNKYIDFHNIEHPYYTPQDLAQDLYNGAYNKLTEQDLIDINYELSPFVSLVQEQLLRNLPLNKDLDISKQQLLDFANQNLEPNHLLTRQQMKQNAYKAIYLADNFNLIKDNSLQYLRENKSLNIDLQQVNHLGIDINFIDQLAQNNKIDLALNHSQSNNNDLDLLDENQHSPEIEVPAINEKNDQTLLFIYLIDELNRDHQQAQELANVFGVNFNSVEYINFLKEKNNRTVNEILLELK